MAFALSGAGWAGCGGDDDGDASAQPTPQTAKQQLDELEQRVKEAEGQAKKEAREAYKQARQLYESGK